ncbi:DUF4936 family protein [Roseateles koreensis]|uniref:DUF4936 family protein n=1 Tax=Roseateles koreensis TaxID=2987526 RepID=A0ABT5KQV9_9BURK|nr:DUF4936 family protein [Roseateles koreensis]MDC8785294.1 DUF4936 family protein [Roseateles koreensis]
MNSGEKAEVPTWEKTADELYVYYKLSAEQLAPAWAAFEALVASLPAPMNRPRLLCQTASAEGLEGSAGATWMEIHTGEHAHEVAALMAAKLQGLITGERHCESFRALRGPVLTGS